MKLSFGYPNESTLETIFYARPIYLFDKPCKHSYSDMSVQSSEDYAVSAVFMLLKY